MSSSSCLFDRECPLNEVCYVNVSWRENGCDCSTFYGWSRNKENGNCVNLDSSVSLFWLITAIGTILLAGILFIFAIIDIVRLLVGAQSITGAIATTIIFLGLCFLTVILSNVFVILNLLNPIYEPMQFSDPRDENSDKIAIFTVAERTLITLEVLFGVLATMNIPLFWYEVALNAKAMKTTSIRNISRFRVPLLVFDLIFFALMMILGPGLDLPEYVGFIGIPIAVCILFCYILGWIYLSRTLRSAPSVRIKTSNGSSSLPSAGGGGGGGQLSYEGVIRDIRRTTALMIVLFPFYIAAAIVSSLFSNDWKEESTGGVNLYIASIQVRKIFLVLIGLTLIVYCHPKIAKLIRNGKSSNPSSETPFFRQSGSTAALMQKKSSSLQHKRSSLASHKRSSLKFTKPKLDIDIPPTIIANSPSV